MLSPIDPRSGLRPQRFPDSEHWRPKRQRYLFLVSAASSTSPRSGSSRVNPYPVGEATESSPFEIVPSVATQATHSWEQGGSLDLAPIRDDTSPTTPSNQPTQVMSPNLGQGLASGSNQAEEGEAEMDTAMARAILQSWSETRAEDGSVQRTYTQCAREWPLLGMEAFENIEGALNVLKRACEYLHEGMMQMGRTVEQKANIPSVEAAVRELAQHTEEVRNGVQRTVTRQTDLSNRLDSMSEHLQAARGTHGGIICSVGSWRARAYGFCC